MALANDAFTNSANGPPGRQAAFVIDVQHDTIQAMAPEDLKSYLDDLGKYLSAQRAAGNPVMWATIGKTGDMFHSPKSSSSYPLEDEDLVKFGFMDPDKKYTEHNDILNKFLKERGPKQNEAIVQKLDFLPSPQIQKEIDKYLGNIDHVEFSGTTSTHCVTMNAAANVIAGRKSSIRTDLVAGWEGAKSLDTRGDFLARKFPELSLKSSFNRHMSEISDALTQKVEKGLIPLDVADAIELNDGGKAVVSGVVSALKKIF